MHSIRFLFFVLLLSVLTSCAEDEVYYHFHHISGGKWYHDSRLTFRIDTLELLPSKRYDVAIEITSNRSYPYRDLWMQISHDFTDTLFHTDTLHYRLADEYGRWLGNGAGGLNQLSLPYLSSIMPDTIRSHALYIRQIMNDDPLGGVEKIGVKVSTSTPEQTK